MGEHKYLDTKVRIWAASDSIRLKVEGHDQPMYVPKNSAPSKHLRKLVERDEITKSNKKENDNIENMLSETFEEHNGVFRRLNNR
ncbi:hypothetical protein LG329_16355 [Virgibacillus necropolis]|uniref:hypothetical protein n=1 Tax=Virgibacillus necropolis TaxID=163877 RepID=UPI00384B4F20